MKFDKLEDKYKNFYAPIFKILVEGNDLVKDEGMEIVSVMVDNTLEGADRFSFTINNTFDSIKRKFNWLDDFLAPGKRVEIKMGYTDETTLELMCLGLITSIRVNFPSSGLPQMEVSGYDLSYPLMKNKKTETWSKVTDSDVVKKVSSKYNLKPSVENTTVTYPIVKKGQESDFEFITKLAKKNHYEFYVFGEELFFQIPKRKSNAHITLEWGKNLISFTPEINLSGLMSEVMVRSWNPKDKKSIVGKSKLDPKIKKFIGKLGMEMIEGNSQEKVTEQLSYPVFSQQEADLLAKSILEENVDTLIKGSGESIGIPNIKAGSNIILDGLGKNFSMTYYIKKANHTISSSGYRTTFNVEGNLYESL